MENYIRSFFIVSDQTCFAYQMGPAQLGDEARNMAKQDPVNWQSRFGRTLFRMPVYSFPFHIIGLNNVWTLSLHIAKRLGFLKVANKGRIWYRVRLSGVDYRLKVVQIPRGRVGLPRGIF